PLHPGFEMHPYKGLLQNNNGTWAANSVEKLAILNIPIYLSVNKEQYLQYQQLFNCHQLIEDATTLPIGGPLKGILSAHLLHSKSSIFVLACDLQSIDTAVLHYLAKAFRIHTHSDAIVFTNEQEVEPLCGIYSSKALATIANKLQHAQLQKHSMKYVLEKMNTTVLPLPSEWTPYFKNYNYKTDIATE
ncbi:MAG: molybdenum cofactor guanylyltransferase, partial [Chitinophagaceae bacterium]